MLPSLHRRKVLSRLCGLSAAIFLIACPNGDFPVEGGNVPVFDTSMQDARLIINCQTESDCTAMGASPCQSAICGDEGVCVWSPNADGTPCTSGNACVIGQVCDQGNCVGGAPKPPCANLECGVDACGNDCGTCDSGFECVQGGCSAVLCGGITWQGCCTATGAVHWCDDGELLAIQCPDGDSVAHRSCGWQTSKGHYDCGSEDVPDPASVHPYLCPGEECPDNPCQGKVCGFVCGQSCGACGLEDVCEDGLCVKAPAEPDVIDSDVQDDIQESDVFSDSEGPEEIDDVDSEDTEGPDEDASLMDASEPATDVDSAVKDALTESPADGDNGDVEPIQPVDEEGAPG